MRTDYKKKAIDGIKRLEGLTKKVRGMIENDEYCPHVLENLLAMKGHITHIQGEVLESHLHTCANKKIKKAKDYDSFISEIIATIGLSGR
jgi:DNA-binding FrmR family transcriptional regulator